VVSLRPPEELVILRTLFHGLAFRDAFLLAEPYGLHNGRLSKEPCGLLQDVPKPGTVFAAPAARLSVVMYYAMMSRLMQRARCAVSALASMLGLVALVAVAFSPGSV